MLENEEVLDRILRESLWNRRARTSSTVTSRSNPKTARARSNAAVSFSSSTVVSQEHIRKKPASRGIR